MLWSWLRIAAAIVAFSGVVAGFIVNVDRAQREGWDLGLVLANFFSLFTILTTLLSVTVLLAAGIWSLRHPGTSPEPGLIALGLAAVTVPIFLLGVVYNVLLRDPPSGIALTDPPMIAFFDSWAVEILHVVMPIYFLLDLLFAPRRRGLPWRSLIVIAAYPLTWAAYTMIRGELVPNPDGSNPWWYPYPFLDPHGDGGYASAFTYLAAMTAGFLAIGAIIIAIGRFRERRAAARNDSAPAVDAVPV
ncbi:Pr6Pr family membrane protein [Microbacterium sp. 2FI]|uniref:Pr6Pr family membrane protein n=1 Tax=Microbacterium sp. 2FI TaxID=2502193 RepID=UPI0010F9661F|nr:Pr6Pr family membrane protein [Microbacterium sp. 2FI]